MNRHVAKGPKMSDAARDISIGLTKEPKKHSSLVDLITRLVREKPLGALGAAVMLAMVFVALFANALAPYGVHDFDLAARLSPASAQHPLGTDSLGRDELSLIILGARVSVIVGLAGTATATAVSTILGLLSGFIGGKFDLVAQRFVDAWMSFPAMFVMLTVMSLLGQGLWQVILVIGILFGISGSRVVRSAVIGIKENAYVQAAVVVGSPTARTLLRHILPNIMAPIIVLFTVTIGAAILAEASISFLGYGIPPPTPTWGGMLSGSGREFLLQAPWLAVWPGVCLAIVVYGINMLGDAVRDILDPRLRGGVGRYGGMRQKKMRKSRQQARVV
jgi:peptide/nickel transport system permease protein